jgi:hypothetical protein
MMGVLSEDGHWHSYLRKAMDIWLPLNHEGPENVLRILINVGELSLYNNSSPLPIDKPLEKLVEDEWAAVPGRLADDLTVDRLKPLVEVTQQFKELWFDETDRKEVLAVVERAIPLLEKRTDIKGVDDLRGIVDDLIKTLQTCISPIRHRSGTHRW